MRSRSYYLLGLIAVLLAGYMAAQQATSMQASDVTIVQVIAGRAKPGSEAQYLDARRQHVEWHRARNDAWAWHSYEVLTGENTGSILTVSSPHKWADRDAREQFVREDQAEAARTIIPHGAPHAFSIWRARTDMGRSGGPRPADPPAPYYTVQHFVLNADAMPSYIQNIRRVSAALDKVNYPGPKGLWYQLLNGGEGPHFVLVTPRKNWAEFEGPRQTLDEALNQALGAEGATLISNVRKGVRHSWTETLRHSTELSYHPASTPPAR
jgi:hypothetical protein